MATHPPPDPAGRVSVLAQANLPVRVRAVLARVLTDLRAELEGRLLLTAQETELSLLHAQAPADPRLQVAFQASQRALHEGAWRFAKDFLSVLEASLAGLRATTPAHAGASGETDEWILSLVDDEREQADQLLDAIAARAEARNSLALQLLGHRLGVLGGTPCLEGAGLPIGPRNLTHALAVASSALELSPTACIHLFHAFEKQVMGEYPALLDVVNATLVGEGILPHLRFIPSRPRPTTGQQAGRRHDALPTEHAAEGAAAVQGHGDAAGTTAPNTAFQPAASPPVNTGFAALQGLLQQRRQLLEKLRPAGQAVPPKQADALAQALRDLRGIPAPHAPAPTLPANPFEQARRRLQDQGVSLAQPELDAFELLGLFRDHLRREIRADGPGDALLQRLRLPLLQLALRDHWFFVDPDHPARQLLDAVSLAGARWLAEDDLDPQWMSLLQQAVAAVEQDADGSSGAFARANGGLQEGLLALSRRIRMAERRQVEAARGREKLALARLHASEEIASRMQGRQLPRFEVALLEQAWADVVSLGYLRHDPGSEGWRQLLDATTRLVAHASGDAGDHAADPALAEFTRHALEQVGYHPADARAIAAQLTGIGRDETDLTSRTELLLQLRARARVGEGLASDPPDARLEPDALAAFDRMKRPGAHLWLELEHAPGQHVRRQLAWTSARTGQTLLLNRRGHRVPAPDLATLARQVAGGQARLLAEDLAPAEAAWRAMQQGLERMATDAAPRGQEVADGH